MKKMSVLKAMTLFFVIVAVSATVIQCKKEGDLVKNLDRSFYGTADSSIYAAFYESNTVATADSVPDVNDVIKYRGVQTIIHEYCATSNCHGGSISPKFATYADVMKYVVPGSPQASKLWNYITTNNFDKAMPPVNSNHELSTTDKTTIFNWIFNGAKEKPNLNDFRPAALSLIVNGCASANCHSEATATGAWARKGLIAGLTSADTTLYTYTNPATGAKTFYCQLTNETLRNQVWNAYKDSVKLFYSDTVANSTFRPYKIFGLPISSMSTRGPLATYDDILLDINYPKGLRSNSSVVYTNPVTLMKYYVRGNNLNSTSSLLSRIDSTLLLANPFTGVYATAPQGDMAFGDGGLKPHEIALIKAWYFADPNIPTVWKYGNSNAGIFKFRKTGRIIKQ